MDTPTVDVESPNDLDESGVQEGEPLGYGHRRKESSIHLRDYIIHIV